MTILTTPIVTCCHPECAEPVDDRSGAHRACLLHWTEKAKPAEETARRLRELIAAGRYDFNHVVVPEHTDLSDLELASGTTFEGAVFGSGTRFEGSRFGDGTTFREAFLGDGVSFRGARFGDEVSFEGVRVGASLKMEKVTFGDRVRFRHAEFGPRASFRDSTLGDGASFADTRWGIGARFECTTIGDDVTWEEAALPESIFAGSRVGANADFTGAALAEALFMDVELGKGARFDGARLVGCVLRDTRLPSASFAEADLSGTEFRGCSLRRSNLALAVVDGRTLFHSCHLEWADLTGVGLTTMRLYPREQVAEIEYTMRRLSWERWYRPADDAAGPVPRVLAAVRALPARFFWFLSDYGRSTLRLVEAFAGLAVAFALLYMAGAGVFGAGLALDPPLVQGLTESLPAGATRIDIAIRALYFSVVTMTTLGYGDISAHPASSAGHLVLTVQVILGYMMLGALVTRLGILFQSHSR